MPSGPRSSARRAPIAADLGPLGIARVVRSEEHTSELQSLRHLVCRLLLEKKKTYVRNPFVYRDQKKFTGSEQIFSIFPHNDSQDNLIAMVVTTRDNGTNFTRTEKK